MGEWLSGPISQWPGLCPLSPGMVWLAVNIGQAQQLTGARILLWRRFSWKHPQDLTVAQTCFWFCCCCCCFSAKVKATRERNLGDCLHLGVKEGFWLGGVQRYIKCKFALLLPLLTFPCCPPLTQSALAGSPFGDASQNTFWFEICFLVPWRSREHLLRM